MLQLSSPLIKAIGVRYYLAAIYTCLQLYTAMNDWLARYHQSDFYASAYDFLALKEVIKHES